MKLLLTSIILFLSFRTLSAGNEGEGIVAEQQRSALRLNRKLEGKSHTRKLPWLYSYHSSSSSYDSYYDDDDYEDDWVDDAIDDAAESGGVYIEEYNGVCFSPESQVRVLGKGKESMKNVKFGDKVLTGSGEFKIVFAMDHFHPSKPTEFVQIHVDLDNEKPLELTSKHLLFIEGSNHPVPASEVKVGDKVQSIQGDNAVTKVERVMREGFYNPITTDGTIVVDGIIASTYASFTGTAKFEVGGMELLSMHSVGHMVFAPYRDFCTVVSLHICEEHGKLFMAGSGRAKLHQFVLEQNDYIKFLFFVVYVSWFGVLHLLLKNSAVVKVLLASFYWFTTYKKKGLYAVV